MENLMNSLKPIENKFYKDKRKIKIDLNIIKNMKKEWKDKEEKIRKKRKSIVRK